MNKGLLRLVLTVALFTMAIGLTETAQRYQRLVDQLDQEMSRFPTAKGYGAVLRIVGYYEKRAAIPGLWLGAAVCGVSSAVVFALPRRRLFVLALMALLLVLPAATAEVKGFIEPISEQTISAQKWHAALTLQQPRSATCIKGDIVTYVNTISFWPDAYACFHLMLHRYVKNLTAEDLEMLEIGYFQNRSGFYLFGSRRTTGEGYHEAVVSSFNETEAACHPQFSFCISQDSTNPRRYCAWQRLTVVPPGILGGSPAEPRGDEWVLYMDITFTIDSENLYWAGAESNNDHITLEGWFKNLGYWLGGEWHGWSTVEAFADPPYSVETVSTSEFYTHGGYRVGDINHDGVVNFLDLFWLRKAYVGEYNPECDLDYDGDVDFQDLYLFRQCYIVG